MTTRSMPHRTSHGVPRGNTMYRSKCHNEIGLDRCKAVTGAPPDRKDGKVDTKCRREVFGGASSRRESVDSIMRTQMTMSKGRSDRMADHQGGGGLTVRNSGIAYFLLLDQAAPPMARAGVTEPSGVGISPQRTRRQRCLFRLVYITTHPQQPFFSAWSSVSKVVF